MQNMKAEFEFDLGAAKRLPPQILFGTSSWTYPGWQGLVYHGSYRSEAELKANCLAEYGAFPWFRTVGIDSSFYSPMSVETLRRYASQLPSGFPLTSKVWEEITIPRYANHARYGARAGRINTDFLNADKFSNEVLAPFIEAGVEPGPLVFEFQRLSQELIAPPEVFCETLDRFLEKVPKQRRYAVEIRNKELLIPAYFHVLNGHNVAHCFNHWSFMPPLKMQMKAAAAAGGLTASFFVARILTPLGKSYEEAVSTFSPYDEIKEPLPEMREDLVRLAKRALQKNIEAFILVNNRAEGNAPLTIDAVGRMIVEQAAS